MRFPHPVLLMWFIGISAPAAETKDFDAVVALDGSGTHTQSEVTHWNASAILKGKDVWNPIPK